MSILSSLNLGTAFSNSGLFKSFQGIDEIPSQQHNQAAKEILDSTTSAMSSSSVQDPVAISNINVNISDSPSLERGILQLNQAGITYTANAKLVKATSSIYDTLFRAVVSSNRSHPKLYNIEEIEKGDTTQCLTYFHLI